MADGDEAAAEQKRRAEAKREKVVAEKRGAKVARLKGEESRLTAHINETKERMANDEKRRQTLREWWQNHHAKNHGIAEQAVQSKDFISAAVLTAIFGAIGIARAPIAIGQAVKHHIRQDHRRGKIVRTHRKLRQVQKFEV